MVYNKPKVYIFYSAVFLIISNIFSFIYRYSKAPDWLVLVQGVIFFLLLLFLVLFLILREPLLKDYFFTRILIFLSFISKALIAIINESTSILPGLSDVSYYNNLAIQYAKENILHGSSIGASGFANYIIGNIYFLLGISPLIISLINCFLYSISILYIVKICFQFKIVNPWPAALIASIMPSSILYIPVVLRESAFLLVSIIFFFRLIVLYRNDTKIIKNHLIVFIYLLLASFIRPQVFPIYLLIYTLSLIYFYSGLIRIAAIFIASVFFLAISYSNFKLFLFINFDLLNLHYFQLYRNAFSDLPNAYLVNIIYNDWFDFISYIPRFLFHYLFAPYPWESSNYKFFMATLDSIFSLIVIIGSLLTIIFNFKTFRGIFIYGCLVFLIITLPFAMIEAYPMGAVRHRMIVLLLVLPLFSLILPVNMKKIKKLN